jgi:hypothetical protein
MLKKIISAILLVGFISVLVWGGINRTLAKTDPTEGRNADNRSLEHVENSEGSGVQQRGNGNQGQGNNAKNEIENAESLDHIAEQDAAQTQGGRNGSGFQVDPVKENPASSADGAGNGVQGENQAQSQGNGYRGGNGNGQGTGQGGGYQSLTATEIEALQLALDDEYHALAVYQSVIADFGEVEPFVEIAASEQRHIDALINHFNKHQLAIPENPWIGNVPAFESIQQACQVGVEAEIANADLYTQLFSMTDNPSLTRVFTNLSNASQNSHLPQFEACQ